MKIKHTLLITTLLLAGVSLAGCGNKQQNSKPTPESQLTMASNKKTNSKGVANVRLHTNKNAKLNIHSSYPNIIKSHSKSEISVKLPDHLKLDKITVQAKQKKHLATLKNVQIINNSSTYNKYSHNLKVKRIKAAEKAKAERIKHDKLAKQREQAKLNKEYPPIQDELQNMSNNQLFMTQATVKGKVLSWGAQNDGSGMILIKDNDGNEFTLEPSHRIKGIEDGSTIVAYGGNFDKQKINSSQTNNAISSEYLGDNVINMPSIDHIKLLGNKGTI